MISALTEEVLRKHTEEGEKQEVVDILAERSKKSLPPISEDDRNYRDYLRVEADRFMKRIHCVKMSPDDMVTYSNGYRTYLEEIDDIDTMELISQHWENLSSKDKMLNVHLIKQYETHRKNITENYNSALKDKEFQEFLKQREHKKKHKVSRKKIIILKKK